MKGLFQCPRGTEGVVKTIEDRWGKFNTITQYVASHEVSFDRVLLFAGG